ARLAPPYLPRLIPLPAGVPLAVGAEGHAVHGVCVPLEGEDFLARLCLPHLYRPILRAAGEARAVGAEGHAVQRAFVSGQSPQAVVTGWLTEHTQPAAPQTGGGTAQFPPQVCL